MGLTMVASGSKLKPLFRVGLAFENARRNMTVMFVKSRIFPFKMMPLGLCNAPIHAADLRVTATQAEDHSGDWSPDGCQLLNSLLGCSPSNL